MGQLYKLFNTHSPPTSPSLYLLVAIQTFKPAGLIELYPVDLVVYKIPDISPGIGSGQGQHLPQQGVRKVCPGQGLLAQGHFGHNTMDPWGASTC